MTPTVTAGPNRAKNRWYADVRWPDGSRSRHLLRATLDDDPAPEIEVFKRELLPHIVTRRSAEAKPQPSRQGELLRDAATWYIETHLPYTGVKTKTIEYYSSSIYSFIGYCQSRHIGRSGQLSSRVVQEWQMEQIRCKGRDRPSREQVLHVRRWLAQALDYDVIPELPAITWDVPKKRKGQQHRAHSREAIEAWVDGLTAWRPKAGIVAQWVAVTGWRISDALDLRVGECDILGRWIDREQIKTSEKLPYPITDRMAAILCKALEGRKARADEHVFLNHRHRPWQYPALYSVTVNFRDHWEGDDITFRDLRKSFGTHLALKGCPPNVLKELMGHSEIAITLKYYVDVDREAMRAWVER